MVQGAAPGSGQSVTVQGGAQWRRNTHPRATQPSIDPAEAGTTPVLLIAEMNGRGHRLYYVSLIAQAAARVGYRVVMALSSEVPESLIDVHLRFTTHFAEVLRVEALTVRTLEETAGAVAASIVIVPDGDRLAVELGRGRRWRSPARLRLLVMRWDAQLQGNRMAVAARLKAFGKRALVRLAGRRPGVDVFVLRSPLWRGSLGIPTVLDPVSVVATAEGTSRLTAEWALTPDRTWLGVLGAVSARKNFDLIAAAMMRVPDRRLGLLVAGTIDAEVAMQVDRYGRELRQVGHEVVAVDKLLSDSELDCAVAAVDVLVLAHSNEGPSGLLLKAQALGTTVVAAGAVSLRQDLAVMGRSEDRWCELNAHSIARALAKVNPRGSRSFGAHTRTQSFAEHLVGAHPHD